jgi:internalin A
MSVIFTCEYCQQKIRVNDTDVGKRVRCPSCHAVTSIRNSSSRNRPLAPSLASSIEKSVPVAIPVHSSPGSSSPASSSPSMTKTATQEMSYDSTASLPQLPDNPLSSTHPASSTRPLSSTRPQRQPSSESSGSLGGAKVTPKSQLKMRAFVLFCGLFGGLMSGYLGYSWWAEDLDHQLERVSNKLLFERMQAHAGNVLTEKATAEAQQLEMRILLYPLLFVVAFTGMLGGVLGALREGQFAAATLLASVAGPAVVLPATIPLMLLLAIGGIAAVFITTKAAALREAERQARFGRQPSPTFAFAGNIAGAVAAASVLGFAAFVGSTLPTKFEPGKEGTSGPSNPGKSAPTKTPAPKQDPKPPVRPVGDNRPAAAPDPEAMVKRAGGQCERDADAPGKPIVAVTIERAQLTDPDLRDLKDLKTLRTLDLGAGGKFTAAGFAHLKNLTNLQELHLGGAEFPSEALAALSGLTALRKLSLPDREYTAAQLAPLAGLVHLQESNLDLTKGTDAKLAFLAHCPEYQELAINGISKPLTTDSFANIGKMTGLTSLALSTSGDGKLKDGDLDHFKGLKNLRFLTLANGAIKGPGLSNLKGLTQLRDLTLSGNTLEDEGLQTVGELPSLTYLNLSDTSITDAGIAQLKNLTNLEVLILDRTKVTGATVQQLKGLSKLTSLGLGHSACTDEGLKGVAQTFSLQELVLSETEITDAGLSGLTGLSALRTLDLQKTKITDAGLKTLVAFPNLKLVKAQGTKVTKAGVELAKKSLPGLNIEISE